MSRPHPAFALKPRPSTPAPKAGLHPRNRHAARYDFPALTRSSPALARFVRPNPAGEATIDFADPAAVLALNQALLKLHYGVAHWALPRGYLCPPIPGRADYLHHVADLLGEGNAAAIPRGPETAVLDIGVGANCIYPLLGVAEYGWRFVGTDVDPVAVEHARKIVAVNPLLAGRVECRLQRSLHDIFKGVVRAGERYALSLSNPPFHASAAEAAEGTARKVRNLTGAAPAAPVRNFGGQANELWCAGGEAAFIRRMIAESAQFPELCRWFTTLVAKRESLPAIQRALHNARAEVRFIEVAHGQKRSRIVAWRFPRAAGAAR